MSVPSRLQMLCAIERAASSADAEGNVTLAWSTLAENVPCLLQDEETTSEQTDHGAVPSSTAVLYLPAGTDIRPATCCALGDRVTVDGTIWRVQGVRGDAAGGRMLLSARLVREI